MEPSDIVLIHQGWQQVVERCIFWMCFAWVLSGGITRVLMVKR